MPLDRRREIEQAIPDYLVHRALHGLPINTCAHLRLCAAIGIDPVTGDAIEARIIGELHWPSLGAALRMKRMADKITLRAAAKQAKASYSALGRIERAQVVSIENVLAACRFLDRHPFEFVSRETTETRSAA